jgi:NADH:ubiquinone oxidoreductase subunit 5 (subunit L)/multisubunit Na+/H+ antiporter MnhA subunit
VGIESSCGALVGMLGVVAACVMLWGLASSVHSASGTGVRLAAWLGSFAVGMVLVMVASDAVLLFLGWECIGVASVLLVG